MHLDYLISTLICGKTPLEMGNAAKKLRKGVADLEKDREKYSILKKWAIKRMMSDNDWTEGYAERFIDTMISENGFELLNERKD